MVVGRVDCGSGGYVHAETWLVARFGGPVARARVGCWCSQSFEYEHQRPCPLCVWRGRHCMQTLGRMLRHNPNRERAGAVQGPS